MLSLNVLTANEPGITAKKQWTMETARLNQPIYFQNFLTSKWKQKGMLLWGRDNAFNFQRR